MKARVYDIKWLFACLFTIAGFSFSQIHITEDIIWNGNKLLSDPVIVDKGATLTINAGVKVQIKFIDTDGDNIGEGKIEVLGSLKIEGTPSDPVLFVPIDTTENKHYWSGIIINSTVSNNSLKFFYINNASTGIDINSPVMITGSTILHSGETGIHVKPVSNGSVFLSDIFIKHSSEHGLIIDSPNVITNWVHIDSCAGYGLVNESMSITAATNLRISHSWNTGLVNYGDLSVTNSIIENNRHGIMSFTGNLVLQECDIINNGVNGLLLGGYGLNTISNTSIENNGGYGIETTKWAQGELNGSWSLSSDPTLRVNNCNIQGNHQTTVLDQTEYDGLWDDWKSEKYSGDGWTNGWSARLIKSIPFGRIGWVSFDYNSNNGGSDFSWQPCTGNSVWSYLAEIRNSRNQKITYLPAPFQCYWNPLAGENSNIWHSYENFTGLITENDNYENWIINPEDAPSSDTYSIWQYFEYAYVPLLDTDQYATPEIKNFKIKFYHGGYEVSSYSDNASIDLTLNYWGQTNGIDTLFNPHGTTPFSFSDFHGNEVKSAHSSINKTDGISFTNPVARSSHQEVKMLNITWKTRGWIPFIDIAVSTDMGNSWTNIAEKIANTGNYDWWNNLITGETFYLRIHHSNETSVTSQIGPLFVIENITPIIRVKTDKLDFMTKLTSLKFTILNEGGGPLSWSLKDNQKWLSLNRSSGVTRNQSVIIADVDRTRLKSGNYKGLISIASNSGDSAIKVRMAVAQPNMSISTERLDFDSTKTEMSFTIENGGGGYIKWKAKPDPDWIILNRESGTTWTRDVITVKVDRSLMAGDIQTGPIRIRSNAGNSSIKVSMMHLADEPDKNTPSGIPYYIQYPCGKDFFDYTVY